MKLLTKSFDYDETIKVAYHLKGSYEDSVIFHSYWNGDLNEKHLYSIMSCYFFNVLNKKHKIILWLEKNNRNNINEKIKKYCEIRYFNFKNEKQKLNYTEKIVFRHNKKDLTEYADFIRLLLLYNYGGCWFDLDVLFLRSFDPIFRNYGKKVCAYQWGHCDYPNNAILISLKPNCSTLKEFIDFFHNQGSGWRTQTNCDYSTPIDILVLPCSWFDSDWIKNSLDIGYHNIFKASKKKYNFNNFFKGAFCYHWHNQWNVKIKRNSIFVQLIDIMKKNISKNN